MGRLLKRLLLFSLLFGGLSAAGTWFVSRQAARHGLTFDQALLAPPVLALILGVLLVYFAADGLRLYFALRALGHRVRLPAMARLVFINLLFSHVTPLATGGGIAQVWYLRRHAVPVGTGTAATTIRTVLAVLFIFSAAPVALLSLDRLERSPLLGEAGVSVVLAVAVYAAFFAVVLVRPRWLAAPAIGAVAGLRRLHLIGESRALRWTGRTKRELVRFTRSFRRFLTGSPLDVALSLAFTGLFLLALFSLPAVLLWGLGYEVRYLAVVGLLVVTTFTMYFAPTPGASGVAEGVFGLIFAGLVARHHLVLVTVAWRFLTVYLGMAIGLGVTAREIVRGGGADA